MPGGVFSQGLFPGALSFLALFAFPCFVLGLVFSVFGSAEAYLCLSIFSGCCGRNRLVVGPSGYHGARGKGAGVAGSRISQVEKAIFTACPTRPSLPDCDRFHEFKLLINSSLCTSLAPRGDWAGVR